MQYVEIYVYNNKLSIMNDKTIVIETNYLF